MYIYICTYICLSVSLSIYIYIYVCTHVCIYIYIYIHMYVYIYISLYIYIYMYIHICTRIYVSTHIVMSQVVGFAPSEDPRGCSPTSGRKSRLLWQDKRSTHVSTALQHRIMLYCFIVQYMIVYYVQYSTCVIIPIVYILLCTISTHV